MPLIKGTILEFINGAKGIVGEKIGEGGQGEVYHINYNGKSKALKWYKNRPSPSFVNNLKNNANHSSPSPVFLWPLAVTDSNLGVGYVMDLVDKECKDFSKFLGNKYHFENEETIINAAINLCVAFQKLHLKGLAYFDLNDGNFFFNPKTGSLQIGDNDNVASADYNVANIQGKRGYMAPEIVLGGNPNRYSDLQSLAIILFRMIFIDHPLQGKFMEKFPCLTENAIKHIYGTNATFIFDEKKRENHATRDFSPNAIMRWPGVPSFLRKTFLQAFSEESHKNPMKRLLESSWLKVFLRWRSYLNTCPYCGNEIYVLPTGNGICPECRKQCDIFWMQSDHKEYIPLVAGQVIYESQLGRDRHFQPIAKVVQGMVDKKILGLRNISDMNWTLKYNGRNILIRPSESFRIENDMEIKFSNIKQVKIKLVKSKTT